MTEAKVDRDILGRWTGSGNPAGRRPGTPNRRTQRVAERLAELDCDPIESLVRLAREAEAGVSTVVGRGSHATVAKIPDLTTAARCYSELAAFVAPRAKGQAVRIDLPKIETPGDVVRALAMLAEAMADGRITPEEANVIAGVVENARKAVETNLLEARIAKLERGEDAA